MKRPVLTIDVDDVLVPHAEPLVEFYNRRFNRNFDFKNFSRNDLVHEARQIHEAEGTDFNADGLIEEVEKYFASDEFEGLEPYDGVVSIIDKLRSRYKLVIITARPSNTHELTKRWLKKHFPEVFGVLEFANFGNWGYPHSISKIELMKKHNVSILLDDSLYNILPAAEAGIRGLLYGNYPWNQADELPPNVKRVKDWQAVAKDLL